MNCWLAVGCCAGICLAASVASANVTTNHAISVDTYLDSRPTAMGTNFGVSNGVKVFANPLPDGSLRHGLLKMYSTLAASPGDVISVKLYASKYG